MLDNDAWQQVETGRRRNVCAALLHAMGGKHSMFTIIWCVNYHHDCHVIYSIFHRLIESLYSGSLPLVFLISSWAFWNCKQTQASQPLSSLRFYCVCGGHGVKVFMASKRLDKGGSGLTEERLLLIWAVTRWNVGEHVEAYFLSFLLMIFSLHCH